MLIDAIKQWNRRRLAKRHQLRTQVTAKPVQMPALRRALGLHQPVQADCRLALGIVTYNNPLTQIIRCLQSIQIAIEATPPEWQAIIYVLHNGQAIDLQDMTRSTARKIEMHELPPRGNVGFGAGHNKMMMEAAAWNFSHYAAINPDGTLEPDALVNLIRTSAAADHKAIIEGIQFPDEHPKYFDTSSLDSDWASGACMLIPRQIYDVIGGFDDDFFMYCEDVDISWRALSMGFAVKTCPTALFFHPTTDRDFQDKTYTLRNMQAVNLLARKWGNGDMAARTEKALIGMGGTPLRDTGSKQTQRKTSSANFMFGYQFARNRW